MTMKTIKSFFLICIGGLLLGCVNNDEFLSNEEPALENVSSTLNKVVVESDYLHFEDEEAFENAISTLITMKEEEFKSWENNLSFESMRSFFNEALVQEEEYRKQFDPTNAPTDDVNSPFVKQNSQYFQFDKEGDILINTFRDNAASVLNKEGIVRVGDILYQYSYDFLKAHPIHDVSQAKAVQQLFDENNTPQEGTLFISKVETVSMDDEVTKLFNFTGGCSNAAGVLNHDKLYGDVWLTRTVIPQYQSFPCDAPECSGNIGLFRNNGECLGTCLVQVGTSIRSVFKVRAKRRKWGSSQSTVMFMSGTYWKNGVRTLYSAEVDASTFTFVIFDETNGYSINVTNAFCGFTAAQVGLGCSVQF